MLEPLCCLTDDARACRVRQQRQLLERALGVPAPADPLWAVPITTPVLELRRYQKRALSRLSRGVKLPPTYLSPPSYFSRTSIRLLCRSAADTRATIAAPMPVPNPTETPTSSEAAQLPRRIFSPIAPDYDRPAMVLSLFQYRRWHRFLLSRLAVAPGARVLDMATGTGAIAFDLLGRTDAEVIGADITRPMLMRAQARADGRFDRRISLVECTAEAPPFAAASFDAVTFAYLLRYVADVPGTLRALARLLHPGGTIASLDFAVPRGAWYPLWRLYTGAALPVGGHLFSRHWRDVGAFLGPSIRDFYRRWPEERLLEAWSDAGFADVRSRRLSLGGAIVIWGTKSG
jgi:demethylmenaquinone methyltransferase / 2-methoxy-6-polyprenyl-1,4-benzoquinol methylase